MIENLKDLWDSPRNLLPTDQVRRLEVRDALVDIGATLLSLPTRIIQQLGKTETKRVTSSQGAGQADMFEAVRLTIQGRSCTMDVMEVPDDVPVLIGQLPLEHLDFVVDRRSRTLIAIRPTAASTCTNSIEEPLSMKRTLLTLLLSFYAGATLAADKPPIYLWFEPEWFDGVQGRFAYHGGPSKPTGSWGIAGPGISAEWTQGGESEWNSMGAAAEETAAECHREFIVPRAGRYKVWVRYVDHRSATEPFKVQIEQAGKAAVSGELGVQPVVPPGDEYELYWGFSFGWGAVEGPLKVGPAKLTLKIDKPGEAWRQLDAVLITDDLDYQPIGREKPPFAYVSAMNLAPGDAAAWRGSAKSLPVGKAWQRPRPGQKDFSMWTGVDADAKWWSAQDLDQLSRYDVCSSKARRRATSATSSTSSLPAARTCRS